MIGVCKFCQCTDSTPCAIEDQFSPCAWLLEDVCDAPPCVEKAYLEARPMAEALMMQLALQEAA